MARLERLNSRSFSRRGTRLRSLSRDIPRNCSFNLYYVERILEVLSNPRERWRKRMRERERGRESRTTLIACIEYPIRGSHGEYLRPLVSHYPSPPWKPLLTLLRLPVCRNVMGLNEIPRRIPAKLLNYFRRSKYTIAARKSFPPSRRRSIFCTYSAKGTNEDKSYLL